jgi:hypothetical protein
VHLNDVIWDIPPCSPYVDGRFGEEYHLHLQGKISELLYQPRMIDDEFGAVPKYSEDTYLSDLT